MILTPLIDVLQRVDTLHEEADSLLNSALRERGWELTCETPGSVWMWRKRRSDGSTFLVERDTAIEMEQEN